MILFEKLFRLAPTERDQWRFLERLGALNEDFLFVERTSEAVLRVCKIQNGSREFLLDAEENPTLPLVTLNHGKSISLTQDDSTLGEKVLPYPWSELLVFKDSKKEVFFSDCLFQQKCELFRRAITLLETICLKTELTFLQWSDSLSEPHFLFHGVRNKILRMGLCEPSLQSLLSSELQKIRTAVLTLGQDNPMNFKGFELALYRIETLEQVERSPKHLEQGLYRDEPIPFEL